MVITRPARADDAESVGRLATDFAHYLRQLGDTTEFKFDAKAFLRDGFSPNPAFSGIVAELEGRVVGYLLAHPGYDTDRAIRLLHIVDLYVDPTYRRHGAATKLMKAAASMCRDQGAGEMVWTVYSPNRLAAQFYERLGARYVTELNLMAIAADSL